MKRFSKKNKQKKVIISINKKQKGGWNNQKYYNPSNTPKLTNYNAIEIGKFLINDELERYFLNDEKYYSFPLNPNKHTEDEDIRRLKIELIKRKFKTDDDYLWLGNQFYFMGHNSNPFHTIHNNGQGYATWDDGVAFFDWLTNTHPRTPMALPISKLSKYKNPLQINYYQHIKRFLSLLGEHSRLPSYYSKSNLHQ
jgi:hypothetical protein